jgi:hypothetical protein
MRRRISRYYGDNPLVVFVLAYFAVMTAVVVFDGRRPSWDQFVILGLAGLVLFLRPFPFVRDWAPFLMLLLGYEYLRGLVPTFSGEVNVWPVIDADLTLFGSLPVIELQGALYEPGNPGIVAFISTFFYLSHAAIPVFFALYLWFTERRLFHSFTVALIVLSFAAFATYVLYPAMPPWMAAERGYIPVVYKVVDETLAVFSGGDGVVNFAGLVRSNPVAAMPSLHAAYPVLVLLYAWRRWRRWGLTLIPYPLIVVFAIIYTGHHYAIDAIVGAAYAGVVYAVVAWVERLRRQRVAVREEVGSGGSARV